MRVGRRCRLDELVSDGFAVLHNRRVPGHGGDVDHIVVAPSGVHVIDSKRYTGRIRLRNKGSLFRGADYRLYVGSRDQTRLVDKMAAQVLSVDAALRGIPQPTLSTPVLCFVDGDWPAFSKTLELDGVRITWPRALVKLLRRPGLLTASHIFAIRDRLALSLPPA
jgi:hypothetical protein